LPSERGTDGEASAFETAEQSALLNVRYGSWLGENASLHVILAALILECGGGSDEALR